MCPEGKPNMLRYPREGAGMQERIDTLKCAALWLRLCLLRRHPCRLRRPRSGVRGHNDQPFDSAATHAAVDEAIGSHSSDRAQLADAAVPAWMGHGRLRTARGAVVAEAAALVVVHVIVVQVPDIHHFAGEKLRGVGKS